jgi:hypothetical protein
VYFNDQDASAYLRGLRSRDHAPWVSFVNLGYFLRKGTLVAMAPQRPMGASPTRTHPS